MVVSSMTPLNSLEFAQTAYSAVLQFALVNGVHQAHERSLEEKKSITTAARKARIAMLFHKCRIAFGQVTRNLKTNIACAL